MSGALLCALYKCNNNIFHIIPKHSFCNCKYDFIFIRTSKNFRTRIIKFFNELFQKQSLFHCNAQRHHGIFMLCRESSTKKIDIAQKETQDDPIIFRCANISWIHVGEWLSYSCFWDFVKSWAYLQGMFRVCPEYVIASSSISSVSVFSIFSFLFL